MRIKSIKTDTYPLIVHAPAFTFANFISDMKYYHRVNPLWSAILKEWARQKPVKGVSASADELTIVIWSNSKEKTIMEKSLERLGVKYICLGKNIEEWENRYKLTTLAETIGSIRTPYIMGLDAFDCILLRDPQEAVEKFKSMKCDALFNGQTVFYPDCGFNKQENKYYITEEMKRFERCVSMTKWPYLNAGAWIAKTRFCEAFVRRCLEVDIGSLISEGMLPVRMSPHQAMAQDDQIIMHYLFKEYYPRIRVDDRNNIFINIFSVPRRGYVRIYPGFYETAPAKLAARALRAAGRLFGVRACQPI